MSISFAVLFLLGEMAVVAALGARPFGARMGLVVACLGLALPLWVVVPPFSQMLLAMGFLWPALRALDLVHESPARPFAERFIHLMAVVDTRAVSRGPRRFDAGAAGRLVLWAAATAVTAIVVIAADQLFGWRHYAVRWGGGAVLMFTGFEVLVASLDGIYALAGWKVPRLHDSPHRSLTLAEFWGARWNRVVGRYLNERVFRPLARVSPWLGITAAFALSAVIHAYIIGIALGTSAALAWAAFFIAQPPMLALERKLGVKRWPVPAASAWTLLVLLALSPLMTEPGLHLFARQ